MSTYTINIAKQDGLTYNGLPSYRYFYRILVEDGTNRVKEILTYLRQIHPAPEWSISVSVTNTTSYDITRQFS